MNNEEEEIYIDSDTSKEKHSFKFILDGKEFEGTMFCPLDDSSVLASLKSCINLVIASNKSKNK